MVQGQRFKQERMHCFEYERSFLRVFRDKVNDMMTGLKLAVRMMEDILSVCPLLRVSTQAAATCSWFFCL